MQPYSIDDAETELRDAIDRDDVESINRMQKVIDDLDVRRPVPTLLGSALWYVEHGMPVFPLSSGSKMPLPQCAGCKDKCPGPQACGHELCHGFKDATLDPAVIKTWWAARSSSNVGIATGHVFDVVDIDGPLGQKSRVDHWEDIFGDVDRDCIAKVVTPRPGGMHIYVPVTGDGNATGIVPGVDYRGIGGYVLAPPSIVKPNGKDYPGTYQFLGAPRFDAAMLGAA